jgi:DNA polymerase-3 subunit epsilon
MSYKKINILSFDTETLGLDDPNFSVNQIIEFGVVPATIIIDDYQGVELEIHDNQFHRFIHCPSFETLKPELAPWVIEHNKGLIDTAHESGIANVDFIEELGDYLIEMKAEFFEGEDLLYLGKSMQSLDAPIMTKHLGWKFMEKWGVHRKKVDVQDVARFLIHQGKLPLKSASSKSLVDFFNIKDDVNHTAIDDSIDMLKIYAELLKY